MKLEMDQMIIRKANVHDLDTLREFEQGVIEAERPFDATLKEGHIHYYDLEELIDADYIEMLVAEINGVIIGSGYARIERSKLFYKIINSFSDVQMENGISDFKLIDKKVVSTINKLPEDKPFLRGLVQWVGYRQKAL